MATEPTDFQLLQQRMAQVGGICWVERLTLQGQELGSLRGAETMFGWRAPGLPGHTRAAQEGPYPLIAAAADPAFAEVIAQLNLQALEQLAAMTAERDALLLQVAQLTGQQE